MILERRIMPEEKTLLRATLVFPVREGEVLLAEKTRKIGAGCLNGYGGGVDGDESLLVCACREFQEETGGASVSEEDLDLVAVVNFHNKKSDGSFFTCVVHVYTTRKWSGEIVSTDEMQNPKWYQISMLNREKLMLADYHWLLPVLSGKKLIAEAWYGPFQQTLLADVKIQEVDSFEQE